MFYDDLILVMNLGQPKGMLPGTAGALYAYQLNFMTMEAELLQTFDGNALKYPFTNLTSFDLWPQDNNTRLLVLANNNTFLFFVTLQPQDYTVFTFQQFDLQFFVQSKNLVLPSKSQIMKTLFLFKSNAIINNGFTYQLLAVTDVVAHFEMELFFN